MNNFRLTASVLNSFLISCFIFIQCKDGNKDVAFTFKQGVSLNHWTSRPVTGKIYADSTWFNKKDIAWIAATGIDHIQLYVAIREIINPDNSLNYQKLSVINSFIEWSKALKLGTVLNLVQFPDFKADSTLPKAKQDEIVLNKQASLMGIATGYFKEHGDNLRFLLVEMNSSDKNFRNNYFQRSLSEIRKTNPNRKVYLSALSTDRLSDLVIPPNDKNICIAAEMARAPYLDGGEPLDIFLWQHVFSVTPPRITFPGTIPAFDSLVTKDDPWIASHSGKILDEYYLDTKFKKVNDWMEENHPGKEFYIWHWRYVTGYPFIPASIKDEASIRNFGKAFRNTTMKNKVNWCVYDYNSGSCIRYTDGKRAHILEALGLKN